MEYKSMEPPSNPPPYSQTQPPQIGFALPPQQNVQQTVVVGDLGGEPRRMTCPYCSAEISTKVKYQSGRMTHIAAFLLFIFCCWPCCCIPYCVDTCMDADHECPNCQKHIGHHRR